MCEAGKMPGTLSVGIFFGPLTIEQTVHSYTDHTNGQVSVALRAKSIWSIVHGYQIQSSLIFRRIP